MVTCEHDVKYWYIEADSSEAYEARWTFCEIVLRDGQTSVCVRMFPWHAAYDNNYPIGTNKTESLLSLDGLVLKEFQ